MEEGSSHGYLVSVHMFTHTHYTDNHIHCSYTHMYTLIHTHRRAEDSKGIFTNVKVALSYSLRNNYYVSLEDCCSNCDTESAGSRKQPLARFAAVYNLK